MCGLTPHQQLLGLFLPPPQSNSQSLFPVCCILTTIISCSPHSNPGGKPRFPLVAAEQTEAQRGQVTGQKSHSKQVAGFEQFQQSGFTIHVLSPMHRKPCTLGAEQTSSIKVMYPSSATPPQRDPGQERQWPGPQVG
jgi:hypothetical protein